MSHTIAGKEYDFVVAANGSGDFLTLQEAIDALNKRDKHRWDRLWRILHKRQVATIHVEPGIYIEGCTFATPEEAE